MLRANDTDEECDLFEKMRYNYPDARVMRRFEILCLHAKGKFAPEIATHVKQNPHTARDVINMYAKGGIESVTAMDSNHPTSDLEKHRTSIVEEFQARPPASGKEAAARIEKTTGVKRSLQRVRIFMGKIDMKFRKAAAIPAKADLEKQDEFKKKCWSLK